MRFTVYGSGAMGGSLGAYLAKEGQDVVFVDKDPDHVRAINRDGLRIDGERGEFTVRAKAFRPEELEGEQEVVLLGVKSQHTEEALRQFSRLLRSDSLVVSIQNGLNEEKISREIGRQRTIGAFVNWGADYIGPGHIRFGKTGCFYIGQLDGAVTGRILGLQKVFSLFLPAQVTGNIWGYLWSKQVFSSVLFSTALTDLPIYDALEPPWVRAVLGELVREAMQVPAALGVRLEEYEGEFFPSLFQEHREDEALNIIANHFRGRIKNKTGVWRDIAVRKRPTEVEGTIGEMVRKGEALGLSLPLNRKLLEMIHELEQGRRRMSIDNFRAFTESPV
jgi:2-dehydropantoate 2-reductase